MGAPGCRLDYPPSSDDVVDLSFAGGIASASSGDFMTWAIGWRESFDAVRSVRTSDVEKSGEGPHGRGAAALFQRIFFRPTPSIATLLHYAAELIVVDGR
jgi:hypothetical protein